jgi:5-methylcytosine-specific restriction endonuclease McrA
MRKGTKHTEESRRKLSYATKRSLQIPEIRAKHNEWYKFGVPRGSSAHNWKGGITPLYQLLRNCEAYYNWRKQVYKRDFFKCQECGTIGHNLIAHHKISFKQLMNEFLKMYNQFSPIEDRETLFRLAVKYEPFWDITNGITVCRKCHWKIEYCGMLQY